MIMLFNNNINMQNYAIIRNQKKRESYVNDFVY